MADVRGDVLQVNSNVKDLSYVSVCIDCSCSFFPGWHRRLIAKAGRGSCSSTYWFHCYGRKATLIDLQLNLVEEQLLLRYRHKTYKFLHEKTTELWDKLEKGTIITSDFLKETAHLYAPS